MDSAEMVRHDSKQEGKQIEKLASLPPHLEAEMAKLDELFTVSTEKLKRIAQRFQEELEKGLRRDGVNIPMNLTWVLSLPTGHETGSYLTLDLGGTNLRVCWVTLHGDGKSTVEQNGYRFPNDLKHGAAEPFWDFIAECLDIFLAEHDLKRRKGKGPVEILLGFTFSYPVSQRWIDHGVLQRWTKGFEIEGVEGGDVAKMLTDAMAAKKLPIRLVALVNDTVGAMMSSAYNDPLIRIGGIFGTGCNAAYMETCGDIPKLELSEHPGLSKDTPMAINCEYGAFFGAVEGGESVLPRTKYDLEIDRASPKPGEQTFEKMSAGLYLGEIFRRILVDLRDRGLIFSGQDVGRLREAYILDTAFLSFIEDDDSYKLEKTAKKWKKDFGIRVTEPELELQRRVAELVATRGARLCTTGIAAICRKKGIAEAHVAADGSVANKHPKFKARWAAALGEILDWPDDRDEDPVNLVSAEAGSGVGAAIIAAMTMERAASGNKVGIQGP